MGGKRTRKGGWGGKEGGEGEGTRKWGVGRKGSRRRGRNESKEGGREREGGEERK
jgi:hypothetical protein